MRRRLAFALAALLFAQTACFGSFGLTVKVWEFNRSVGSKWVQEILFLAMVIIPVYEVASLVDAIVLNTAEFWTGNNPTANADMEIGEERVVQLPDGTPLKMVRESQDSLRVEHEGVVRHFLRTDDGFTATDDEGKVLAMVHGAANGDAVVSDSSGERTYSPAELAMAGGSSLSIAAWASQQARMDRGVLALR